MSMGGASTAQPLDINGALQWNPAAISAFDKRYFLLMQDYFFFAVFVINSTNIRRPFTGVTKDDRGASVMPALAMVWGKRTANIHLEFLLLALVALALHFQKAIRMQSTCLKVLEGLDGFSQITSCCK